jgi:hypothetical protein
MPQVFLDGLDGGVAEQHLDLLEVPAGPDFEQSFGRALPRGQHD